MTRRKGRRLRPSGLRWEIRKPVMADGLGCQDRLVVDQGGRVSLESRRDVGVPELTARVVRASFPKGTLAVRVREALGPLFGDASFAEAFPARGRPAVSQVVRRTGIRRTRYTGLAKTHLGNVLAVTAINIIRTDAWLTGTPLGSTRTSHLARLGLAA